MSVLITASTTAIDKNQIKKGNFIRAQYHTWSSAYNGLVAAVSTSEIRVLYIVKSGNMTNYFTIPVEEIASGLWELSWSSNFTDIRTEGDGL